MLTRLIYFSEIGDIKYASEINDILEIATKRNKEMGITGSLYFDERYFIQIIEGDRFNVSKTYNKIAFDKRHKNIVIIDVAPISKREFPNWSVLYLGKLKPKDEFLLKYSPFNEFNPNEMTAENIIEFVLELKEKVITNKQTL